VTDYKIGDTFEIKDDHLKLLKEMNVYFDPNGYDGAPAVDCKRPYGNSGDVCYDVHRVLNGSDWDWGEYGDSEMSEEMHEQLYKLHMETATALQICLVMQEFKTGVFKKYFYGSNSWEKVS